MIILGGAEGDADIGETSVGFFFCLGEKAGEKRRGNDVADLVFGVVRA